MVASSLTLGAPGVYLDPRRAAPALGGVRMDVCAFVGVAPRGPAREPAPSEGRLPEGPTLHLPRRRSLAVAVESFDEYRRLYGGFEGPGRLPFAVASFFEQGGRRAYVVRVVHDYGDPVADAAGAARGRVPGATATTGSFELVARSEGSWGNRLRAALGYSLRPLDFTTAAPSSLTLDPRDGTAEGALLRLTLPGGARVLRFVAQVVRERRLDGPGSSLRALFTPAVAAPPERAEVVDGVLVVDDGVGRRERFAAVGLSAAHPRWLATVLCHRSQLVFPADSWLTADLLPNPGTPLVEPVLAPPSGARPDPPQFEGGEDRFGDLVPDDFFDPAWVEGDGEPGAGVHALVHLPDLASVAVPDLYVPRALAPVEAVLDPLSLAGPEFRRCVTQPPRAPEQESAPGELAGLALDPRDPADLATITALHERLVELAERRRDFLALLDVPPFLEPRGIERWRARLRSSYAAAYHPWLWVTRPDDPRDDRVLLNPSAVAAGMIARQELAFGIPHGPANLVAAQVLDVAERVPPAIHDALHPAGVNVFLVERDGVVLTAGRTLATDPRYRQLTVRRLMLMLRRTLQREMQWAVFEPNGPALQAEVRNLLRAFLRRLYRAGAFRGAREEEGFFVRCDAELNPRRVLDAGRLVAEVGVAPTEPLEFLVLTLTHAGDGTLTVEE